MFARNQSRLSFPFRAGAVSFCRSAVFDRPRIIELNQLHAGRTPAQHRRVGALMGRSSTTDWKAVRQTVPDLACQWFEAQAKDGLFSPKLDRALLKAPATSVADVVALL
jgi:hypothetical protein